MRPPLDQYFLNIAAIVATRSTCLRRQIGAVIVKDKQILTTGYNGPPSGQMHCNVSGCVRNQQNIASGDNLQACQAVHAEQNAIIQAALHGVSTKDATIYCTMSPCRICAAMLVNAGIIRFVTNSQYPDQQGVAVLVNNNIEFEMI